MYQVGSGPPYFPDDIKPDEYGLIAEGGELTVEILTEAYSKGIFPWSGQNPIPWYSPVPRMVLLPTEFHASRSLRKLIRRRELEVSFDRDFAAVIRGCAETPRPGQDGTWITPNMRQAYGELFARGIAHCVSVYEAGRLCGGLYGLTFGRSFFGESMFSLRPSASKVAMYWLCRFLDSRGFAFLDCQCVTRHLLSLGAQPWTRRRYLSELARSLKHPSLHCSWAEFSPDAGRDALGYDSGLV